MGAEEAGSLWVAEVVEEGGLTEEAVVVNVFAREFSMDSFPFISYSPISSHSQLALLPLQLTFLYVCLEYPLVPPIP